MNTVMVDRETRALSVGAASAGTCSVAQAEGSPITQIREVALSSSRIPPRLHLIIDCYSPCLYRVTATKLICSPRQHLFTGLLVCRIGSRADIPIGLRDDQRLHVVGFTNTDGLPGQ